MARTLSCCSRDDERLDTDARVKAVTVIGFLKHSMRNNARSFGSTNMATENMVVCTSGWAHPEVET